MSWAAASLGVLALSLALGLAWYERSRPPSKLVALVGTLAALAVVGRIAFAALPDVKPTTDIVVISGYALGGAPGFAVGAIAALTSNLFFGEGTWTPWQMAAWGLCGVYGAALARLTRRRIGRIGLALSCGLAGILFGVVMNLYTWSLYGTHTWASYAFVAGRALPFDATHVAANVVFALVLGPVLVRALARFRARLQVTWRPLGVAGSAPVIVAVVLAGAGAAGVARADAARAADRTVSAAVRYLARAQNPDGGLGAAAGQSSSPLMSAWASMGLAAAGRDPHSLRRRGRSLASYLAAGGASLSGAGDLERTILALRAAGAPPRARGRDLVAALLGARAGDGSWSEQCNLTAFGIFALRAVGRSPAAVAASARWLTGQQNTDGGFSFAARGAASDIDDTAAVVQALATAQRRGPVLRRAVGFLVRQQRPDGGFSLAPGEPSNAQSSAWAIQGLVAAGRDPARLHRRGGRSPLGFLRSLAAPDGSIHYSRTSAQTPVWVTAQALTALARRPLPIRARARGRGHRGRAGARRGSRVGAATSAAGVGRARPVTRSTRTRSAGALPAPGRDFARRLSHLLGTLATVGGLLAAVIS